MGVMAIIASDPGQVRYLPVWSHLLQPSTLESAMPWLPFRVIDRLDEHLTTRSRVFEYGGGGSTLWFAAHAGHVVTVEHDDVWFSALQSAVGCQPESTLLQRGSANDFAEYVHAISIYPDGYFDVVVVDGRERVRCVEAAMPKVRPRGLLVLDDSDRPRYAGAFRIARNWPCITYKGLTPAKAIPGVTTVWQKPE